MRRYSEALSMYVEVRKEEGSGFSVITEDGCRYGPDEFEMLRRSGAKIPAEVHVVKKCFGGTLIDIGRNRWKQK